MEETCHKYKVGDNEYCYSEDMLDSIWLDIASVDKSYSQDKSGTITLDTKALAKIVPAGFDYDEDKGHNLILHNMDSLFKKGDLVKILPLTEIPASKRNICVGEERTQYAGHLAIVRDLYKSFTPDQDADGYGYNLSVIIDDHIAEWDGIISAGLSKWTTTCDMEISSKDSWLSLINKAKDKMFEATRIPAFALYNENAPSKICLTLKREHKIKFNFNN